VKGYRISWRAGRDLDEITERIARESGQRRAELFRAEILRNISNLALFPHAGHEREDLTSKALLF